MNCNIVHPNSYCSPISGQNALTCQSSRISIQIPETSPDPQLKFSNSAEKTKYVIKTSAAQLCKKHGVEKIGFLTLTHSDYLQCVIENQRRWNSLSTNELRHRYSDYIAVLEFTKIGVIHMHILIVMKEDIKTGFNFKAVKNRDYSSVSPYLKNEWKSLRKILPRYNFGTWHELHPVKTTLEQMVNYLVKYITKSLVNRLPEHKGVRLVRLSKNARSGNTNFSWISIGASIWRAKLAEFAKLVRVKFPDEKIDDVQDLTRVLGAKWAYFNMDYVFAIPLPDKLKPPL
jgi:hypothetical protein